LRSLPHDCVGPIVQFYATLADLHLMVEDMRLTYFRDMSADRRLLFYQDYAATRLQLSNCAVEAKLAINTANQVGFLGLANKLSNFSLGHLFGVRQHLG
jgi:hypothetical protein